ncbi:NAD-dependent succinate-semialdehyde dehydrogenase [Granulicella sp. WH15]|uniref:NAD-dependent succinate-semialdehyde dehydrogenase n=1 Tax=Granulicella sp. WH15 TaxID=2602070 RepID=UPI0013674D3F|nr:NAD-dependent succinate-semialdehyde dehydrogenase [Granulicella sp. WH15]QHN04275.1 NAD-dependent succinate-semialdehyde dehydrogenase [Granulicella sp. WH15]
MAIASINPATGNSLRTFEPLGEEAIRGKIALAAQSFKSYGDISLEHRALWMRRLAAIMEAEVEELAALITTEMGKPLATARQEIQKCASCCRYFAENASEMLAEEPIEIESGDSYLRWDPLGVILAVMPWNFPFWQVFRFLAPALMAGNVGLLKHSSNVPQCALAIEALVRRAGFPRGTFQTLLIESKQVEMVLADERVAAVTLTGSEPAGRAVAAQAGQLIKKSVLELGGSDPFIVMPSTNLDQAVATAVKARTINNGQSCIAAKRFIVHEEIYDEFERRFVAGMEALKIGDPMLEDTQIGPLATPSLVDELEKQVEAAVLAGGRILTGGKRITGVGNFFGPTVIADVPRSASVYRDEFFGPVAMLFRAKDVSEAIEIANDTPFGLAASVWTRDYLEQQHFVRTLECGGVFLNAMVSSDPRLPFGGIKRSGYGRELAAMGMKEFLNAKTVMIAKPEPFDRSEFSRALDEALILPPPTRQ